MFVAVLLGIVVGVAGFVPLIYGMNKARNATPTSNLGHAGALLLGVLLSTVILAAAVIVCVAFFRDMAAPFAGGAAGGLIAAAAAFGISKNLRK
jgi:hypothetical protein